MDVDEARKHSAIARKHLDKVQTAAWEPDPESAVTWAFYAYENCLAALAARYGRKLTRNHHEKAELARKLYADGLISRDVGDELEELNSLRKDVAYDEPGPELQERDLESLASELEEFITETESRIDSSKK